MRTSLLLMAGLLVPNLSAEAKSASDWLLPNFADRIAFTVRNPTGELLHQVVLLPCGTAPSCPGRIAIAIEGQSGLQQFLPTQVDDTDGDGVADTADVMIAVPAHASRVIHVYYSSSLQDRPQWPGLVYASHSYGFNRATAAIESTRIGYRTYGGFLLDVQAHRAGKTGLLNALLGYSSTSHPLSQGRDIVHYGQTLGLGGLYIRGEKGTFRPPFNTPDYAGRSPEAVEPTYKVLSEGPLRAAVEARLEHWATPLGEFDIRALFEMRAEEECVRVRLWITPLQLAETVKAGVGVVVLPRGHAAVQSGMLAVSGLQDAAVGRIALGLRFDSGTARDAGLMKTPDGENRVVEFSKPLVQGQTLDVSYTVAAAWERSGAGEPMAHVLEILRKSGAALAVADSMHESTPKPEDLQKEPR